MAYRTRTQNPCTEASGSLIQPAIRGTAYIQRARRNCWIRKRLLTIEEVCEWLSVGATTLWKLHESGQLIRHKINKCVRYSPDDVQAYLKSTRSK